MNKIIIGMTLVAGLTACASTLTPQSDTPATKAAPVFAFPHYKRPNLVVADIDRSLTIYRDILGFSGNNIQDSSADSFSYPVFNIPLEATLRFITLGEPSEARTMALTEVTGITMAELPNAPHRTAHVIGVEDLSGKIDQIQALGLETTESKIAGGSEFRFIEQAFTDFDGHLIVLYEILPD